MKHCRYRRYDSSSLWLTSGMHNNAYMAFLVPFVLILHFTSGLYKTSDANTRDVVTNVCVKTVGRGNVAHFSESDDAEDVLDMQPYQKCENTTTTNYCFTLWEESQTNGSIKILRQGNGVFIFIKYIVCVNSVSKMFSVIRANKTLRIFLISSKLRL